MERSENMKKLYITLLFLMLSASYSLVQGIKNTSQDFNIDDNKVHYYLEGKEITLTLNEDKVCVSIPKDNRKTSDRILANVKVQDTIKDEDFDIIVISQSDFKKLSSQGFWEEDFKSVILTSSYRTKDETEVFATPYITLRLKKEQDINLLVSYAEQYGLEIVKQDPFMPLWYILAITPKSGRNTLECAKELWESGAFSAAIPDFASKNLTCSNDPMFDKQWGLYNSKHPDIDISASAAWNYFTGKNIKIAILDTGVDLDHIDLATNISSLSYDTETNSSPSIVHDNDHGTHCAGIAAAKKDNGIHIAGVAPDATIVSISNKLEMNTCCELKLADGINWAYQNGVDIISNSWRTSEEHLAIKEAIQNAFRYGRHGKGCIIVFAAGNKGTDSIDFPARCNDTILAVGSIVKSGWRAIQSDYGEGLDLVAPGVGIYSTLPNDSAGPMSGTSMACPHVAGVAALILERNSELTVTQVNSIINSNARRISGVNYNVSKPDGLWNYQNGYGLVNAYESVIHTPSTVYIQNDTITGTRLISAENIYVGRDVTDTKAHGDVILGQGDITLHAECVEIKNSTTVPLGTTLTIEN